MSDVLFWIYISIIGFFGGVIGTIHREEHLKKETLKGKFILLWFGGVTGIFIGYLAGEFCFYLTENQRISLAASALVAWIGAKVLVESQNRVLDFIQNYKRRS